MGRGKAFDPSRFFIFCANALGSPYGSASPITTNPLTNKPYGPEFPPTTIRDDVRVHKLVLDHLGVSSVGVVIGGSMGGMTTLEWPLCSPPGYVKHIVPLATSARHSAWCISWGEAQRQAIYSDPEYMDGYYYQGESGDEAGGKRKQPESGLAAARMTALLTYRSRDSFEHRFGRKPQLQQSPPKLAGIGTGTLTPPESPKSLADEALAAHNEGHRNTKSSRPQSPLSTSSRLPPIPLPSSIQQQPVFSAQSYLRYQGSKFTARFDANCYIHITRKMDTHDLARDRIVRDSLTQQEAESRAIAGVLARLPPRPLVIGIETDGLFTTTEQRELAEHIPNAELVIIPSPDGHDGFLLEFEQINTHLLRFLKREFPLFYVGGQEDDGQSANGFEVQKTSIFGEAEADVARW
jgi:homoserine O-acetyltransferase/O-succinyltransferase